MAFDGTTIAAVRKELSDSILGGRIYKIAQPEPDELLITIKTPEGQRKLYISASASLPLIYLTDENKPSPMTAPGFCMLLRKYVGNGRITAISQPGLERILFFDIEHLNELGDLCRKRLIVEIMGKHSNIILLDKATGKIIEAIKHVGFSQNSYRTILPGSTYVAPPKTEAVNPFTIKDEALFAFLHREELTPKNLQIHFQGLGRDTAQELASRLETGEKLKTFRAFFEAPTNPRLTKKSFAALAYADSQEETFETLSDLLDHYYLDKAERDRVQQQAGELIRKVDNELEKNRKKLAKQEAELAATENAEEFRQKGELLTTFLHQVPNDQDQVTLDNYYTNQPITIALDKALTPSQNAQRYFKRYQKLKEAVKHLTSLIQETKETISYLETVETALAQASLSEVAEIREELIQTGFIKRRNREKIHKRKKPEKYLASDGKTIILVGRNNLQNEELTFKMAKKDELWFHAKDIPGSHVVITGNLNPSDEVKTDAAELAAYFSKGRLSNLVQVDMIETKKLNKPTGGKPGFVTYTGQKTLRVTPEEEKIKSMRISD